MEVGELAARRAAAVHQLVRLLIAQYLEALLMQARVAMRVIEPELVALGSHVHKAQMPIG